jgi:hypothetical protein
MVFGGFPKQIRNKTFYFHTKKNCFIYFVLCFGPRVHFRGQKLTFRQKNLLPKNRKSLTTLFISLKVAHSAQEAPNFFSARWLLKKLKTIEVGFKGIGCVPAL